MYAVVKRQLSGTKNFLLPGQQLLAKIEQFL